MSNVEICPVCNGDMEDSRHVSVECFYDVHEVVPEADKSTIFREVEFDAAIWGVTRRYSGGTKDRHVVNQDGNVTRITIEQDPVPPIRLVDQSVYSVTCCKACRGDFLRMFGKWARGKLRERRDDDDDRCIPVRVNGSTVMMTRDEYDAHRMKSNRF